MGLFELFDGFVSLFGFDHDIGSLRRGSPNERPDGVEVGRDGIKTPHGFTPWHDIDRIAKPGNGWFIILTKDGENRGLEIGEFRRVDEIFQEAHAWHKQAKQKPDFVLPTVAKKPGWLAEAVARLTEGQDYRQGQSPERYLDAARHPSLSTEERVVAAAAALKLGASRDERSELAAIANSLLNKATFSAIHALLRGDREEAERLLEK